ncbi:MAG: NTP transferase domain-containing protein, partial [Chloroflexota bacterium]
MEATRTSRVVVIVPVGTLDGAKSRLGETLDAEERRDLVTRMVRRTVEAAVGTPGVAETIVVTPDDDVRGLALAAGARPLRQRSQGLNRGLREAREEAVAGGADAVLVLPIDLPMISP